MKMQYRVNEQIRAHEVRIVGDDIESVVMPLTRALQLAEQKGADLVEISPNAEPPVCRIIDYSKFLYQQKKRQKEIKAKQVKVEVKEIRFGPQTDEHDYNFKLNTYSSADVASSSRNRAKSCFCVLQTTLRNMVR